jgi:curli biogenesis system outer membrane secretion channel CsgG
VRERPGGSIEEVFHMRMRSKVVLGLALVLSLGQLAQAQGGKADGDKRPRIAIIEFENQTDWWGNRLGTGVQNMLVTELVKSGKWRVVEREKLNSVMKEQSLSLSGAVSSDTLVKIGKILGVKYFLTGSITQFDIKSSGFSFGVGRVGKTKKKVALDARLVNTESGEIEWADTASDTDETTAVQVQGIGPDSGYDEEMAGELLRNAVAKIIAAVNTKSPA